MQRLAPMATRACTDALEKLVEFKVYDFAGTISFAALSDERGS
jgi:hypothetical protein